MTHIKFGTHAISGANLENLIGFYKKIYIVYRAEIIGCRYQMQLVSL